jgi:hypothetical protein
MNRDHINNQQTLGVGNHRTSHVAVLINNMDQFTDGNAGQKFKLSEEVNFTVRGWLSNTLAQIENFIELQ